MKLVSKPLPHGKQTVTPYIIVKGAAQFVMVWHVTDVVAVHTSH
jgi:hypothetical protein